MKREITRNKKIKKYLKSWPEAIYIKCEVKHEHSLTNMNIFLFFLSFIQLVNWIAKKKYEITEWHSWIGSFSLSGRFSTCHFEYWGGDWIKWIKPAAIFDHNLMTWHVSYMVCTYVMIMVIRFWKRGRKFLFVCLNVRNTCFYFLLGRVRLRWGMLKVW